jgi:hypothetical protein
MLKKVFLFFCITAALFLGACRTDDNPPSDPVAVNPTLPDVPDLPGFSADANDPVSFVSSKEEAFQLAGDTLTLVINSLEPIFGSLPIGGEFLNIRAAKTETIEEIINNDTTIPGAVVTGFVQGSTTASFADEDNPFSSDGDSAEINLRAKIAIDYENYKKDDFIINGKCHLAGDPIYGKGARKPEAITIDGTVKLNGGYALSISDTNKKIGAKIILDLQIEGIKSINLIDEPNFDTLADLFTKFAVKVDVYDNEDTRHYSESYGLDDFDDLFGQP